MILAAYIVTGMLVASVYAVGHVEGPARPPPPARSADPADRRARPAPVQFMVGDTAAREVADNQPAKFAGMECIQKTGRDQTEYLGGRCTSTGVKGGIGIPGLDSFLVGFSTDTKVTGLDAFPPKNRPPANTLLHLAFDFMVGVGSAFIALGAWVAFVVVAKARHPADRLVPALISVCGVAAVLDLVGGLDRHRGRAPAVDRPGLHAHRRRGHPGQRGLVQPRGRAGALRGARHDRDPGPAADGAALARGWTEDDRGHPLRTAR